MTGNDEYNDVDALSGSVRAIDPTTIKSQEGASKRIGMTDPDSDPVFALIRENAILKKAMDYYRKESASRLIDEELYKKISERIMVCRQFGLAPPIIVTDNGIEAILITFERVPLTDEASPPWSEILGKEESV